MTAVQKFGFTAFMLWVVGTFLVVMAFTVNSTSSPPAPKPTVNEFHYMPGYEVMVGYKLSPSTPGLPTPPPPLPTQVTNGDGTRYNCTPNYQYCWPAH